MKSGWTEDFRLMAILRYFPEGIIKKVSLLHTGDEISYHLSGYGFKVEMPNENQLNEIANVVKI